jgi:hypothetical protein
MWVREEERLLLGEEEPLSSRVVVDVAWKLAPTSTRNRPSKSFISASSTAMRVLPWMQ